MKESQGTLFVVGNMKKCCRCGKTKHINRFPVELSKADGHAYRCLLCERTRTATYRNKIKGTEKWDKHLERIRHRLLEKTFGITNDEYESMLASQKGLCAICHQPERIVNKRGVKRLAVDHDHVTGKVRQLLCNDCNTGVGLFKENPELLLSAVEYLKKHKA